MDALSDVISMLRVSSALSSRFEGRGAWAFHFPAYRHMKFGCVLEGRLLLRIDGEADWTSAEAGDFYLLTNGQAFCSASDAAVVPLDGPATYRRVRDEHGVVRHPGRPGATPPVTLAGGRFTFENEVSDLLLRHLPPLIHLRADAPGTTALSHLSSLLDAERSAALPGAHVARSHLAAMVLVHVLRIHLATAAPTEGWLGALADARIGKALGLMHAQPAERWTVDRIAAQVGMSRSAFAERFRRLVGSAPLDYLQRWRMRLAQTALRQSDESLSRIALRVGYQSDTAFSSAFRRWSGQSPGSLRAAARDAHTKQSTEAGSAAAELTIPAADPSHSRSIP